MPPYYDSMIAKLIVHGATREDALARMRLALAEMRVEGIATNLPLHREIVRDEGFAAGGVDIHHLERWLQRRRRRAMSASSPTISVLGTSALLFEAPGEMNLADAAAHLGAGARGAGAGRKCARRCPA